MRQLYWACAAALAFGGAVSWSGSTAAACVVKIYARLPVTTDDGLVTAQGEINGRPARFRIESGANISFLSAAFARELGLSIKPIPVSYDVLSDGKLVPAGRVFINELRLSGSAPIKGVNFIAGGSFDGVAGQIGQDILGRHDAEFDLAHGAVRLTYADNCLGQSPVYWASKLPVRSLPIDRMEGLDRFTEGVVIVNGTRFRARFASSYSGSSISVRALKKLGITPERLSAGNEVATLDTIDIGGERLDRARLRVKDFGSSDVDLSVGLDFFLAHRIYVANEMRQMYFTYEGGPTFGVLPAQAGVAEQQPATPRSGDR